MTDAEQMGLIQAATAGDRDALQRLIVHWHGALRRLIAPRISTKLRRILDVDDVLQQAYVAAYRSIESCTFKEVSSFCKWLERIALNSLVDCRRTLERKKRNAPRPLYAGRIASGSSTADLLAQIVAPGRTPSSYAARREVEAIALAALARLPDDQRTVVNMRFFEGRSVPEIASELERTTAAINSLTSRGLKALRAMV